MSKYNVLLVDDEEENLSSTKDLLHRWGYRVDAVSSGNEAIECIRAGAKEYAVALLDYRMPEKTGAEVATEIRALNDEIILLMHSAYPSVESLTATIRAGILNFVDKNEDLNYLRTTLAHACSEFEKTRKVKPPLTEDDATRLIRSIGMIGKSAGLAHVAEQIQKFRGSQKPVLVLGETGVGKEMVAKALHQGGPDKLFVVNCAAFQGSALIESELFGHEKGAFTGAVTRKVGILEAARGGTVYLDELHYLDMQSQGKLLRALREKKIRRVGGLQEENVDFRLVASSWPNIEERVVNGTFLPDLYYRLKFLSIEIPPLRERPEDIAPLALHFADKHFKETGVRKQFLMRTIRYLEKYSWPGNVGELDGYISALFTESHGDTVDETLMHSRQLLDTTTEDSTYAQLEARQEREKRQFIEYSVRSSKSILHAAKRMGMKPSSLNTLITRFGMRDEIKEVKQS